MATTLHAPNRAAIASALTLALVLVLVLGPEASRSHAVTVFGALRAPGDPSFVAGHRGDRSQAPENTVPAIQHALAGPMLFVEVDVRLTADGVPVLMHDATVDRTTNGSGRVDELTWAELSALDAGSWYGPEHSGIRVPSFDEFLALLADSRKKGIIELKGTWTPADVAIIDKLVASRSLANRMVAASFEAETLDALKEAAPDIPRMVLLKELPDDPVAAVHRHSAIALVTNAKALKAAPHVVESIRAAGLGLLLYTLNEEESWAEALAMGVDGVITDVPSELDGWLARTAPGT